MNKRWFLLYLFMTCVAVLSWAQTSHVNTPAQDPLKTMDSLLAAYQTAPKKNRVETARQIISLSAVDDQLIELRRPVDNHTPVDTLHFLVWLSAERFYYNNSYFKESLAYIDKALPLASGNAPIYHATLLCDRGYCLFKTSHNVEASKAEQEAEQFSKKHQLMMPLARAYNYMAIINLSLGCLDEAKHFVEKAIETDRLTGSDQNTHNYLGIACEVYNVAKEPKLAIDYGRRAVESARAIGFQAGVVNHLSQLSYAYNRNGDYEQALSMAWEAVHTVEQMPVVDRNLLAISLEYVAFNLLDMKRNSEAVPVIRRAIALQEALGNFRSVCYDQLSLAEALEKEHPHEANTALHRYAVMLDSLHHVEMHETLSQANASLHNDELQETNAQNQRRTRQVIIGSVLGFLLLLAIIAVLAYLNLLRLRTQRATEQLQTARERFFTNVTHEFRTPLTVILGVTRQLMRSGHDDQSLVLIERNGEQLLTLVNQLLDVAKATSGVGSLIYGTGNLVAYVSMCVEAFHQPAQSKGVRLSFQSQVPQLNTEFVPDYMDKILSNLLTNALKFTPRDGEVDVLLQRNGQQLLLKVNDTGQGIQPSDLNHIFEPFYQGNHQEVGTGVGLSLVKSLAEALGGHVSVESEPGKGSSFCVALPVKEPAASALSAEPDRVQEQLSQPTAIFLDDSVSSPSAFPSSPSEVITSDRPVILVVEDNADVATYIGMVLSEGYQVFYAANGAEGLSKASELMPDLIVTDVMMPDVDGLELCHRIRSSELTSHIPIIIITARVADNDRMAGIEVGADAYLCKPFLAEELLLRVAKLMEQRRLLQQKFMKSASLLSSETPDVAPAPTSTDEVSVYERNVLEANERFLRKLDDVILTLMPLATCDATNVASQLCMSRQQLGRKLRAIADMTPSDYIISRRLEEVRRLLLEEPSLSLLDVALRCGFADNASLTHTFRRKFGVSPSQYVNEKLKNN